MNTPATPATPTPLTHAVSSGIRVAPAPPWGLTPSEASAVREIIEVGNYKAVASSRGVQVGTVESQVRSALAKSKCAHKLQMFREFVLHEHRVTRAPPSPQRLAATPDQLAAARDAASWIEAESGFNVQVDDDALISDCENGTYWVRAWVLCGEEDGATTEEGDGG